MSDSPFPDKDPETEAKRKWFRTSVLPHEPQLRDYIRRIGRGRIDVEDLSQDVLVRLFSNQNWRQVQQPAAFMRAMARNLVIDALRREKVVAIEFQGDLEGSAFADETAGPEEVLIGRDDLRRLAAAVVQLPPQQRRVFTLRKVYGLSLGAIAERLGLSVSTVEKHLVRGLRSCSERLAQDLGPGPDSQSDNGPSSTPTSKQRQRHGRPLGRTPR
jgi:RNA polymerase sigma-70 factor (ECF subfamily)